MRFGVDDAGPAFAGGADGRASFVRSLLIRSVIAAVSLHWQAKKSPAIAGLCNRECSSGSYSPKFIRKFRPKIRGSLT